MSDKPWVVKREECTKKRVEKEPSVASISFEFGEDLTANITSKVPEEIVDRLIKEGILDEKNRNDGVAIRLAMIALVDDVVTTIVADVYGSTS